MNTSSLVGHVLQLFEHIDGQNQPADRLAGDFFRQKKYLGSHDRRFISDAVYGMIRHRRLIKTLVKQFVADNPGTTELEGPHIRHLPMYVVYLLTIENKSNLSPAFWKIYFPKIDLEQFTGWITNHKNLDFLASEPIAQLGVKYSFPDWMVSEWQEQIGGETENLLQALNSNPGVSLRVNLLKTTREDCQSRLLKEGIETELSNISPAGLISRKRFHNLSSSSFLDGWYEIQDEGSQLVSRIADPHPGEIVIDACAGAGGKSLHMAQLMKNDGEIIAIDVDKYRLTELEKRAKRAGVSIIKTRLNKDLRAEEFYHKADLVLVDAPCSGAGTIRRSPWMKWGITEPLVEQYAEKQKNILSFNSQFVKPGGKLVYATCSLFRKENDEIVNHFLNSSTDFQLVHPGEDFAKLGLSLNNSTITMYPHCSNTDGFFVAVMKRV
jgi:16S rRNA (cytosine967-C5)-methyltransferase